MQAPRGAASRPPALSGESFTASDGTVLPLRHWNATHPRAVMVALHGMNDYSNAFAGAGPVWANAGITTYAYDQRGFGAGPHPGLWSGGDAMRADLCEFVGLLHDHYPGLPVFALGESMGGAVVLTALAAPEGCHPDLAGAVLVSPAVWSRADMPLLYRVSLFLGAHLLPSMTVTGRGLHIVPSDNLPMLRAMARDPLVQKETRIDAIYGLTNLMDEARAAPAHLVHPPPLLVLRGDKDPIIPKAPSEAMIAQLGARAKVIRYPKGYHMLERDLDGVAVDDDIAAFVRTAEPVTRVAR